VPVGGAAFQAVRVVAAIDALPRLHPEDGEDHHAEDDVHEVEEGQRDVEHVEGVGRHRNAGAEFFRIFENLDRQEAAAAQERLWRGENFGKITLDIK